MAELVDALGSGPSGSNPVRVQVSLRVKVNSLYYSELDRPKMPRDSKSSSILDRYESLKKQMREVLDRG